MPHTNVIAANPSNWVLNKNVLVSIHSFIHAYGIYIYHLLTKGTKIRIELPVLLPCKHFRDSVVCFTLPYIYVYVCVTIHHQISLLLLLLLLPSRHTLTLTHTTILTQPKLSLPMRNCLLFEIRSASISLLSLSHCSQCYLDHSISFDIHSDRSETIENVFDGVRFVCVCPCACMVYAEIYLFTYTTITTSAELNQRTEAYNPLLWLIK